MPVSSFNRTLTATAHQGDTTVYLDDTGGLRVGYSGLSNLTDYWAAEALITRIDGDTVTLSKPLPKDIPAGTQSRWRHSKYRPFSEPGTADYEATIAGWQRYVGTVARFVSYVLGTTNRPDKGFDMEIWNELTFGSRFLNINNYYARRSSSTTRASIWSAICRGTAAYADAHPADFRGVAVRRRLRQHHPLACLQQRTGAHHRH